MLVTLLECSCSMSFLILLLSALTPRLSRRYSPRCLYGAWLVVVLGLLVPFRFHLVHVPLPLSNVTLPIQRVAAMVPKQTALPAAPAGSAGSLPAGAVLSFPQFLLLLWIVGAAFVLARALRRHRRFLAMVHRWGEEERDPGVLEVLRMSREEVGVREEVWLLTCPWIAGPMMTGFFHPTILLPRGALSPQELAPVLRHELVHWRRRDLWCKGIGLLATALHWFNPLVFLMGREVDTWCEISCDAEVVKGRSLDERQRYSETILRTASRRAPFSTVLSTSFAGGKRAMKSRLGFILDVTTKKTGIFLLCLVLLGTLGTGTLVVAPARAEALASSLLSAWQLEQKSTVSEEEKIHSTVDTYFSMGYADRMSPSFVSRAALLETTAAETSACQTWAQYADASLKYNILCWQAQGYIPASYSYAPRYGSVSVANDGLTATVTMEPFCELRFASRTTPDDVGSEQHVLALRQQNGVWRIMGDASDLDSVAYPPGTDFEELTRTFPARFAAWKNEQKWLSEQAQTEASSLKQSGDPRFQLLDPQKGGNSSSAGSVAPMTIPTYTSYDRSRAAQWQEDLHSRNIAVTA